MSIEVRHEQKSSSPPGWDHVHHVSNYYDFPLEGLADFNHVAHVFFFHDESYRPSSDPAEESELEVVYALFQACPELMDALVEKQAIFERWHVAFSKDPAMMKDHPTWSDEKSRYDQLGAWIVPRLEALRKGSADLLALGNFERDRQPVPSGHSNWASFQVQWRQKD